MKVEGRDSIPTNQIPIAAQSPCSPCGFNTFSFFFPFFFFYPFLPSSMLVICVRMCVSIPSSLPFCGLTKGTGRKERTNQPTTESPSQMEMCGHATPLKSSALQRLHEHTGTQVPVRTQGRHCTGVIQLQLAIAISTVFQSNWQTPNSLWPSSFQSSIPTQGTPKKTVPYTYQ